MEYVPGGDVRNLLNKTTDLKSLLLLDTCGLIYSNELKKIVMDDFIFIFFLKKKIKLK